MYWSASAWLDDRFVVKYAWSAVVDFEESGAADPHFDFRYLPGKAHSLDLLLGVIDAYERRSRTRLRLGRVMAWHVLTVLGDALWRTEAGVALPGGGAGQRDRKQD